MASEPTAPPTLLVTNSGAGSADDDAHDKVYDVLGSRGPVTREACDSPGDLRGIVDAFAGDRIVVAGGDGSLHTLVNLLAELDRLDNTDVGLVPMGTGNDFARGVGLPFDPVAAAQAIRDGTGVPVDVLRSDDGELTVNAAHAGLGAVASERAQAAKPVAGALAYPLAALSSGVTAAGDDLTIEVDGALVHRGHTLFVLVANGPSVGGGAHLAPAADPSDGAMDILVIGDVPVTDRPGLALALGRGTHRDRDDVRWCRGGTLRVHGDPVDHSRDGEVRHALRDVTYTVRPAAWRLVR